MLTLDDGDHGAYDVRYPDVITPSDGGEVILSYGEGAGDAAIRHVTAQGDTVFTFGVPLEAIVEPHARDALLALAIEGLQTTTLCETAPEATQPREEIIDAPERVEGAPPRGPDIETQVTSRQREHVTTGCAAGATGALAPTLWVWLLWTCTLWRRRTST